MCEAPRAHSLQMRELVEGASRLWSGGDGWCPQTAKQTEPGPRCLIYGSLMSPTQNKAWSKDCHETLVISHALCYRRVPLAPKPIHKYVLQHPQGTCLPGPSCHLIAHHHSCLGWNEFPRKQHPDKLICVFPDSSHRLSLNFPPGSPKCQQLYSYGFLCIMSPC